MVFDISMVVDGHRMSGMLVPLALQLRLAFVLVLDDGDA